MSRDSSQAEQIAAEATLFWSMQRDTAWVVRAECSLRSREIPEAYGCWAQVSKPQSVSQLDLLALADVALDMQENRLAEWANTAAERGPVHRQTWLSQRLNLSVRNQLWGRVVTEAAELRTLAADDGRSWLAVAEAELALNRFPQAAEAYAQAAAAQSDPLLPTQLENMRPKWSQLLLDLGEWEPAATLVTAELEEHPEDAATLRKHATILRSRGEFNPALEVIVKAHQLRPSDERIRLLHAILLIDTQRQKEAAEILRRLIAERPRLPEPRHRYAILLRQQGMAAEAMVHEREAQRLSEYQRNLLALKHEWNTAPAPETARQIAETLRNLGMVQEALAWDELAKPQK
jgi:tetratricopeptide (TPR) repeat protein